MNRSHPPFPILLFLAAGVASGAAADQNALGPGPYRIRLHQPPDAGGKARVEVIGLDAATLKQLAGVAWKPEEWADLFAVFVGDDAKRTDRPPVVGSYRVERDVLCFEPRFPLERGLGYRAVFRPARLPTPPVSREPVTTVFRIPKPAAAPTTVVEHVYPSADRLPENQLKFYLHFSAPMSRGEAYRHVHLLDAAGKEVDLPFLELDEELWDARCQRFTLFFDPGRIKRGLKPREEVGPALEEGKGYTFVVDRDWPDAQGDPLKESYRKSFRVGPPDDQPVDPKSWKLQPPAAGTTAALVVDFPKPLEHALLNRLLWVTDPAGKRVAGKIEVTKEETRWQFTPAHAWQAATYQLVADTALEDLAGNSIGKPFEIDVFHPVQRQVKSQTVQLPFRCLSPTR